MAHPFIQRGFANADMVDWVLGNANLPLHDGEVHAGLWAAIRRYLRRHLQRERPEHIPAQNWPPSGEDLLRQAVRRGMIVARSEAARSFVQQEELLFAQRVADRLEARRLRLEAELSQARQQAAAAEQRADEGADQVRRQEEAAQVAGEEAAAQADRPRRHERGGKHVRLKRARKELRLAEDSGDSERKSAAQLKG